MKGALGERSKCGRLSYIALTGDWLSSVRLGRSLCKLCFEITDEVIEGAYDHIVSLPLEGSSKRPLRVDADGGHLKRLATEEVACLHIDATEGT